MAKEYKYSESADEMFDSILKDVAFFVNKVNSLGYVVHFPYWQRGELKLEIVPDVNKNEYLPCIVRAESGDIAAPFEFMVEVTKCRLLDLWKCRKFAQAYEQAADLVEYLNSVDFSEFPTVVMD